MSEVFDWDVSANANNDTPPDGFPEDMDYDKVNDSAREVMAAVARDLADTNGSRTTSGTAPDYVLTPERTIASLTDGLEVGFQCHSANSAQATTLKVGTLTAADLELPNGDAPDLVAGGVYLCKYETTNSRFVLVSASQPGVLLNSQVVKNSGFTLASGDVGKTLIIGASMTIVIPSGGLGSAGAFTFIDNSGGHTITFSNGLTGGSQNRLYFSFVSGFTASGGTIQVGGTAQPFFTLRYLSSTTRNHVLTDF